VQSAMETAHPLSHTHTHHHTETHEPLLPVHTLQMLNFRCMYIVADLGDERAAAGCSEKVGSAGGALNPSWRGMAGDWKATHHTTCAVHNNKHVISFSQAQHNTVYWTHFPILHAAPCHTQVLVAVRAHADGSFDMQPGFSEGGRRYRFEDDHGAAGRGSCRPRQSLDAVLLG
jgi:hypothetical protein